MATVTRLFPRNFFKNTKISCVLFRTSSRALADADIVTHTGQTFAEDDYKRVRFTDREKTVNSRFAIDLIDEVPPTEVDTHVVSCDGGGVLGHPKVYINLDQDGPHACGYCGLRFVLKHGNH